MAPLDETLEHQVASRQASQPAAVTDSAYFGQMDAAQLDSAFEPLGLIAKSSELKVWNSGLSVDAKRRFLTDFWEKRDPSPGSGVNQKRREFYGLLAYANTTYKDRDVPGWKTDRGRIFVKYGAPDDVWRRPLSGRIPAYEIWRYTRGRGRWFIFADRTGFQNYKLMTSNDLQDGGVPDWRDIMTEDGVKEAGQILGVDFYSGRSTISF
jgi:GWxTD domain-containing protein